MGLLRPGDRAPDFRGLGHDRRPVTLADHHGRWLVLFFYPKDETYGCTIQACSHRDSIQDYTVANIAVLGVSTDTIESHARFAEKEKLPYPLIGDPDKVVCKAYGTLGLLGRAKRVTYLIDPAGVIRHVVSGIAPGKHKASQILGKLDDLGAFG